MSEPSMTAVVADDRSRATITLTRDGQTFAFDVDAGALSAIINLLGQTRSGLLPNFPDDLVTDRVVPPHLMRYDVPLGKVDGWRALAVRHPYFGWLAFNMAEDAAADLARRLTRPLIDDAPTGRA